MVANNKNVTDNKKVFEELLKLQQKTVVILQNLLNEPKQSKPNTRSRTMVDGRHIANATTDARETTIFRLFQGEKLEDDYINNILPCGAEKWHIFAESIHKKYPELASTIKLIGGLGGSKDYTFTHEGSTLNIELKSSNSKLSKAALEKLQKTPWNAYCEFLQGQLKVKSFQEFLGPYCEEVIIKEYFEKIIVPFMTKYTIEGSIDYDSYKKVIYPLGAQRTKILADERVALGARNLIKFIQSNKDSQAYLSKQWKTFSNEYMNTNRLDDENSKRLLSNDLLRSIYGFVLEISSYRKLKVRNAYHLRLTV